MAQLKVIVFYAFFAFYIPMAYRNQHLRKVHKL